MGQEHKTVALIPVRGGSKSIPLKNIRPIAGRPLVYWAIDAALGCKYIDKVCVSTDSEAIAECVRQYRGICASGPHNAIKLACISRSPETATDTASTESVMLEFADTYEFSVIILIQATNPLLITSDLEYAFGNYFEEKYDSLLSVVRQKRFIWQDKSGLAVPVNYDPLNRPMRQNFGGFLVENGSFYITRKDLLLESGCRISGTIGYYEMQENTYFELDEPSDWLIIEGLLKK